VLTVTAQEVPDPETPRTEVPERRLSTEKSEVPTPVTLSEKRTLKTTLAALAGLEVAREMETTDGGVVSRV